MKLKIAIILLSLLLLTSCSTKSNNKDNKDNKPDKEETTISSSLSISYIDEDTDKFDYESVEQWFGVTFYLDDITEEKSKICDDYFKTFAAENDIKGDFTNLGRCEFVNNYFDVYNGYAYTQAPISEESSFYYVVPDTGIIYYCPPDSNMFITWQPDDNADKEYDENATETPEENLKEDVVKPEYTPRPDIADKIGMVMMEESDPEVLLLCIGYLESYFIDCGINEEYTYVGRCDNPTSDVNSYIQGHLTDGYAFITSSYDYFYYVNPNTKSVYYCAVNSEVFLVWKDGKAADEEAASDFLYSNVSSDIGDVFYSEANLNGYYEFDCDGGIYTVNWDMTEIYYRENYSAEEQLIYP